MVEQTSLSELELLSDEAVAAADKADGRSWNEWAEGNHLEPCEKWGNSYLEATKRVLLKP